MRTLYQHVTDPTSVVMHNNEILENTVIIAGGATYGRMLFTFDPLVLILGRNNLIRHCYFELI
jgi:hypothetical protein